MDFITKASTTSVIAVVLVITCMALLFVITAGNVPKDDTTRTQIIQGVFGLLMLCGGYYFGASKQRSSINAETVNTVNTGTEEKESK